jgi:cyclic pyranopterin phosphate synthase
MTATDPPPPSAASGDARMIDVSGKASTLRTAVAEARITMAPATLARIEAGTVPKGDVLAVARVAGIMAGKRTADLLPLCHPLPISGLAVDFAIEAPDSIRITASCRVVGPTGVEMEALTAVAVAALSIYDMCKALDPAMTIDDIRLLAKEGGRSGRFERAP